ncbi:MAG: M48 family metalloprotease [Oligoflexia bacterium]|nr:M48 family metalloprotease [Oligoflexia bacterium]
MKNLFVFAVALTISSSALAGKNYDTFLERVGNFIGPTVENTLNYWDQKFQKEIHPFLIRNYKSYYKYAGSDISDVLYNAYVFWEPFVSQNYVNAKEFWEQKLPDALVVPASAKRSYEAFINVLWNVIQKYGENTPGLTDNIKMGTAMTNMLLEAQKPKTDKELALKEYKMNMLLSQLRPYVADFRMASCYRVFVIQDTLVNSFNTGCNIYITEPVIDSLTENELRAVLAHELAHGDHGDSVKSFVEILKSSGKHVSLLVLDDLDWIVSGNASERMQKVVSEGNLSIIVDSFSQKAPAVETAADKRGARILMRAGYSKEHLKDALIRLHELSEYSPTKVSDKNSQEKETYLRQYPSLAQRLLAIDSVR